MTRRHLVVALRTYWTTVRDAVAARWDVVHRDPDAGYSTETVLVTALLVVAAIAVVAIITAKIISKARGINL
ncbi:hypothetical protein [Allokutzneria sp. NRRL B-24872]|uniref:hypothetical protein n=1 Tax=Allokutzneria sp. NRRL B-24872 TaxID=1137961 RepID=UPI000A3A2B75|nr:hypothetical protein [Allokutzneria sp. NRRL B-24872]